MYRGLEFEKLPAFTQRIAEEFPGAQILPSNTQPDKSLRTREGQFVQVRFSSSICSPLLPVPGWVLLSRNGNDHECSQNLISDCLLICRVADRVPDH